VVQFEKNDLYQNDLYQGIASSDAAEGREM